ncbi:WecB/TagA/CpsF family glycosyltransferase, partial [uncultured Veillonella sp.]|uniref:WecB/TagA/CpsF family glycosyltransferase n=1 Tax=uncultured Veillonella sp. TaxID=159268 RepID=UPI0025FC634E
MRNQLSILDVPVDVITMKEAVQRVQNFYSEPGLHSVVTVNAEMVMRAQQDKELHDILKQADIAVPDGAGVLWAAEQMGQHIPERVAGCDLAVALLAEAAKNKTPVYFLGAAPGVAEQAVKNMEARLGSLQVVGIHSGFF